MDGDGALFQLEPRTHARRADPDTSHEAADRLSDQTTMLRALLETFVDGDRTADEAAELAGFDAARGAWKRVSDLTNLGLLADTGERRTGSAGRPQMVRRITAAGVRSLYG